MKVSQEKALKKRFYILNIVVSLMLLVAIVVSVFEFGSETFNTRRTIGMILPDKITDIGWNKSQYDGMRRACEDLNFDLVTAENVINNKIGLNTATEKLIKKRAKTIFFTGSASLDEALEVASYHPNVTFYGIEAEVSDIPMNKYFVRYADAYYLAGILAGLKTSTKKVGFIAPHSSPSVNQMVNAFAVGVRKIKPNAQILLVWTGGFRSPAFEEQAVRDMKANNVDVISYFSDGDTVSNAAARARIDFISLFSKTQSMYDLATITVNWTNIYKKLFESTGRKNDVRYVADIRDRGVEVVLNKEFDARGTAIFEAEVFELREGKNIFRGPLKDNRGILRAKENEIISLKNWDKMNYLAEGVVTLGN